MAAAVDYAFSNGMEEFVEVKLVLVRSEGASGPPNR